MQKRTHTFCFWGGFTGCTQIIVSCLALAGIGDQVVPWFVKGGLRPRKAEISLDAPIVLTPSPPLPVRILKIEWPVRPVFWNRNLSVCFCCFFNQSLTAPPPHHMESWSLSLLGTDQEKTNWDQRGVRSDAVLLWGGGALHVRVCFYLWMTINVCNPMSLFGHPLLV